MQESPHPLAKCGQILGAPHKSIYNQAPNILRLMSRRQFLVAGSLAAGGLASGAVARESLLSVGVTRYRLTPTAWPVGLKLSLAVIADLHACEPWMTVARIEEIVSATNSLNADVVVLLGDYVAGHNKVTAFVADADWARALGALRAPLGVYAILGNHDWWNDDRAQLLGRGPTGARIALEHAGIPVLENDAVKLSKMGEAFWIAGLGDQEAFLHAGSRRLRNTAGVDNLDAILDNVSDDAPVVLLAHEPDIFPRIPSRIGLTLAGHTHGGQVRIFGQIPIAPSPLSRTYNYGHFYENGRHLIVSGGLGCSWWPVRLGVPPEVLHVSVEA